MFVRHLVLVVAFMIAVPASLPAQAQSIPGYGRVERVYPVGEHGTKWKLKCGRNIHADTSEREGFHDRAGAYEIDRPQIHRRGHRTCIQTPVAAGRFVGYRARANAQGRIFDQFVSPGTRPGDRIALLPSAQFVGYDHQAHLQRPTQDWGDRYFPGYPYGARY